MCYCNFRKSLNINNWNPLNFELIYIVEYTEYRITVIQIVFLFNKSLILEVVIRCQTALTGT